MRNPIKKTENLTTKFKETLSAFCLKCCSEYSSCPLKREQASLPDCCCWGSKGSQGMEVRRGRVSNDQWPAITVRPSCQHIAWQHSLAFQKTGPFTPAHFPQRERPGYSPTELKEQILTPVLLNHPSFNICNKREFIREQ